jgi:hypothetical protein
MRAFLSAVAVLVAIIPCFSQLHFEKGYFIDNDGERTVCLIKNPDWYKNPETFEYKLTENSDLQKATINEVAEVGIDNGEKFIRFVTEIDKEPQLTYSRSPRMVIDTLFLKVLIEGKASLFQVSDSERKSFFVKLDHQPVKQLIFRKYLVNGNVQNGLNSVNPTQNTNRMYQQQLLNEVACGSVDVSAIKRVDYSRNDLVDYINSFNACSDPAYKIQIPIKEKDHIVVHLKIAPGLDFSSMVISNEKAHIPTADFGTRTNLRFGVEAEFVMPFHRKKWSILAEPTLQSYGGKLDNANPPPAVRYVEYRSFEVGLGVRYYTFLSDATMLFVDAIGIRDVNFNSVFISDYNQELNLSGRFNYALGAGIQFKRISMEARWYSKRNVFGNFPPWVAEYSKRSVIVGYRIK